MNTYDLIGQSLENRHKKYSAYCLVLAPQPYTKYCDAERLIVHTVNAFFQIYDAQQGEFVLTGDHTTLATSNLSSCTVFTHKQTQIGTTIQREYYFFSWQVIVI